MIVFCPEGLAVIPVASEASPPSCTSPASPQNPSTTTSRMVPAGRLHFPKPKHSHVWIIPAVSSDQGCLRRAPISTVARSFSTHAGGPLQLRRLGTSARSTVDSEASTRILLYAVRSSAREL